MTDIMKMETSELSGAELDYWVAKAEGLKPTIFKYEDNGRAHCAVPEPYDFDTTYKSYSPSTDWSIAGKIIERERISITERLDHWAADAWRCEIELGSTALEAAMRAYVKKAFRSQVAEFEVKA